MACFVSMSAGAPLEAMPMRIEVEFDVFSGMPNPTWVLTAGEADVFARQLAALRRVSSRSLSGHLGYRGFMVQMKTDTATRLIRIQNGTVEVTEGTVRTCAADDDRKLERWLLEAAKPHVTPELFRIAERELR
jgi:hypothetical protein